MDVIMSWNGALCGLRRIRSMVERREERGRRLPLEKAAQLDRSSAPSRHLVSLDVQIRFNDQFYSLQLLLRAACRLRKQIPLDLLPLLILQRSSIASQNSPSCSNRIQHQLLLPSKKPKMNPERGSPLSPQLKWCDSLININISSRINLPSKQVSSCFALLSTWNWRDWI